MNTEMNTEMYMFCPYCKSMNIKILKIHISKPIGAKNANVCNVIKHT